MIIGLGTAHVASFNHLYLHRRNSTDGLQNRPRVLALARCWAEFFWSACWIRLANPAEENYYYFWAPSEWRRHDLLCEQLTLEMLPEELLGRAVWKPSVMLVAGTAGALERLSIPGSCHGPWPTPGDRGGTSALLSSLLTLQWTHHWARWNAKPERKMESQFHHRLWGYSTNTKGNWGLRGKKTNSSICWLKLLSRNQSQALVKKSFQESLGV